MRVWAEPTVWHPRFKAGSVWCSARGARGHGLGMDLEGLLLARNYLIKGVHSSRDAQETQIHDPIPAIQAHSPLADQDKFISQV